MGVGPGKGIGGDGGGEKISNFVDKSRRCIGIRPRLGEGPSRSEGVAGGCLVIFNAFNTRPRAVFVRVPRVNIWIRRGGLDESDETTAATLRVHRDEPRSPRVLFVFLILIFVLIFECLLSNRSRGARLDSNTRSDRF